MLEYDGRISLIWVIFLCFGIFLFYKIIVVIFILIVFGYGNKYVVYNEICCGKKGGMSI